MIYTGYYIIYQIENGKTRRSGQILYVEYKGIIITEYKWL
jgi:hypothetical protein